MITTDRAIEILENSYHKPPAGIATPNITKNDIDEAIEYVSKRTRALDSIKEDIANLKANSNQCCSSLLTLVENIMDKYL